MIPQPKPITVGNDFAENPHDWMSKLLQQDEYKMLNLKYLLAHADDGVIWGQFDQDGGLQLARDEFPQVALSANTLQQARIFGEHAEIFLWKNSGRWTARIIRDDDRLQWNVLEQSIDEQYWLWGIIGELGRVGASFTLLIEAGHDFRHAPPVTHLNLGKNDRAALKVRHYVGYDDEGQAYIGLSRLVNVEVGNVAPTH